MMSTQSTFSPTRTTLGRSITVAAAALLAVPAAGQPTEPTVFVVNNVSDDVSTFTMNDDGTLNFIGIYAASEGPQAATVTPDGRYLAVAHGTGDNVTEILHIFAVNPDASLSLAHTTLVPDSPLATKWLTDDMLAVIETSLSGPNFVHSYRFDPDAPELLLIDSAQTGSFSTSLAVHPKLDVLYAQDSTYNSISAFAFDADGNLSALDQISTGGIYPLDLVVTGNGGHLYAGGGISGGGHAIVGCDVTDTGGLKLLEDSPFFSPGQSPAYTAVSSDSSILFVGHGTDATVGSFLIDGSGSLTSTGFSFDVGMQGTVGDLQVLGDYLLVTDESAALDGITGLYSFLVKPSGVFVAVADIYDTLGVRPEAIVVWDPPVMGDATGDGVVDVLDLLLVLSEWGADDSPADVNHDGIVDVLDLLLVLGSWT